MMIKIKVNVTLPWGRRETIPAGTELDCPAEHLPQLEKSDYEVISVTPDKRLPGKLAGLNRE